MMETDEKEGLIKFKVNHQDSPLHLSNHTTKQLSLYLKQLAWWHARLRSLGMIGGKDPKRYHGDSFGNLSFRMDHLLSKLDTSLLSAKLKKNEFDPKNIFVITGTQTGHVSRIQNQHMTLVHGFSLTEHTLHSRGLCLPSSESLTHAALYQSSSLLTHVFHVHAPRIWQVRQKLNLPQTPANITYGTKEMALAIQSLINQRMQCTNALQGVIAMGGHQDGLLSYATNAQQAGQQLLALEQQVTI